MPLLGIIAAAAATPGVYGKGLPDVFAARRYVAPSNVTAGIFMDTERTAAQQAGIQAACLFITLGMSIGGGLICGFLFKLGARVGWIEVTEKEAFQDTAVFLVPEDAPHHLWEAPPPKEGNMHAMAGPPMGMVELNQGDNQVRVRRVGNQDTEMAEIENGAGQRCLQPVEDE